MSVGKTKIRKIPLVSIFLVIAAFLVMLHQYYYWRVWFEIKDIHHELFISALIFAAVVLIIYANRRMKVIKVRT